MEDKGILIKFKISYGSQFLTDYFGTPPALVKVLEDLSIRLQAKTDKTFINELNKLIKENPSVPQLKNYLTVAYIHQDNYTKATEINKRIIIEHPNYLFAKINAANNCINIGQPEKALEYLGESLSLQSLFPERDEFHFTEVTSYYYTTILYAIAIEDEDLAENRFTFLKAFDENNPRLQQLKNEISKMKFRNGMSRFDKVLRAMVSSKPIKLPKKKKQ